MNENLNNNKPKINVPRPNLTWLYIVIAAVFAYLLFTGDGGSASKEVTYTEFKDMVSKGYASKITAYDDNKRPGKRKKKPNQLSTYLKKMLVK